MPELLGKLSSTLELLLTPATLLQLGAVALAVLLAWWFGRRLRNTERARAILLESGFQARLIEAALIISPHVLALVLIASLGGVLHALKAPSQIVDHAITL